MNHSNSNQKNHLIIIFGLILKEVNCLYTNLIETNKLNTLK
jgi:hypothetical protein